jgi:hypothetical protein
LKESAVKGIVLMLLIYLEVLIVLGFRFPGRPKLPVFGHLGLRSRSSIDPCGAASGIADPALNAFHPGLVPPHKYP